MAEPVELGAALMSAAGPARQADALELVRSICDVRLLAELIPTSGAEIVELLLAAGYLAGRLTEALGITLHLDRERVLEVLDSIAPRPPLYVAHDPGG